MTANSTSLRVSTANLAGQIDVTFCVLFHSLKEITFWIAISYLVQVFVPDFANKVEKQTIKWFDFLLLLLLSGRQSVPKSAAGPLSPKSNDKLELS